MIIKIGANEYKHQFKIITLNAKTGIRGFVDADGVMVWNEDILAALNELATVRQERDDLKQTIYALARMWSVIDEWHSKVVDRLVKGKFDSAKELAIMEYPCLQGHRNQMALIKIGKNEFDNDVVVEIISKLQAGKPKESPDEV